MRALLPVFAVSLALLTPASVAAAQQRPKPQVFGVAGWGGRVRRDTWAPVIVEVFNPDKTIEGTVEVMWAQPSIYQNSPLPGPGSLQGRYGPVHRIPVILSKGSRKRFSLTLAVPRSFVPSVWAYLISDRGAVLAGGELKVFEAQEQSRLVAVVGSSGTGRPAGLDGPGFQGVYVRPDQLPEDWRAYGPLQGMVWHTADGSAVRSRAQWEALRTWISSGGRFIVARADAVGLEGTRLADLLPVTLHGTRTSRWDGEEVALMTTKPRDGTTRIASDDGLPLVVEAFRDGGRATFAAFDPSGEPFRNRADLADFWGGLLNPAPPKIDDTMVIQETPPMVGSRAFAVAAYKIPGVAPPDMRGLFILILAFLAVVSPIDYFLLRQIRRLEWTWYTFPAYALLFTGLVVLIGAQFARWRAFQNELVLEDRYSGSTFTRRRAASALLAPARLDFTFTDAYPAAQNFTETDFLADIRMGSGNTWVSEPSGKVRDWLLQRNSTGIVVSDRCREAREVLDYSVRMVNPTEVNVTVKNDTGVTYRQGVIVTRDLVYTVGDIPPGTRTFTAARRMGGEASFTRARKRLLDDFQNHPGFDALAQESAQELLALTFATAGDEARVDSGVLAGVDILRWVEDGGMILLAWDRQSPPAIQFDPSPGVYTRLRLTRVFRRPQP